MDELMKDPAREAQPDLNASVTVVDVTFRTGGKVYYFDPGALEIPAGAHVIIDTARGVEFGTCVAAAHADGLGRPIKGDRLYGSPDGGRLFLHAESLSFLHPATGERMTFEDKSLS